MQRAARKRVDDLLNAFSKADMLPPSTRSAQSAASPRPWAHSAAYRALPKADDDARRLQVASDLLPSSGSILARRVKKPPKKRSLPVPVRVPQTRIRVKSTLLADGVSKPNSKRVGESKATPMKEKKVSDSRRCFVFRAFHREERLCISLNLPDEMIKERRRAAHRAAGLEWDRLHRVVK